MTHAAGALATSLLISELKVAKNKKAEKPNRARKGPIKIKRGNEWSSITKLQHQNLEKTVLFFS